MGGGEGGEEGGREGRREGGRGLPAAPREWPVMDLMEEILSFLACSPKTRCEGGREGRREDELRACIACAFSDIKWA